MNAVSVAESLERLTEVEIPDNPYPGLRPFELHESHLFFGRDGQSERVISLLAATRFVAVVGSSGSGKSSLVRAGLLPALLGGMMTSAGSEWRIALIRPGNDPIGHLAEALNECGIPRADAGGAEMCLAVTEAILRRGNLGLVEAAAQGGLTETENLLVLVDQFEELFRFAEESKKAGALAGEAAAFVKLLLGAKGQRDPNIYVVLTMRSDYLGDCAQFWDLPETINQGQYLIPRLARDQLRAAIEGPAAVGGGEIAPLLVNRLLNDIGDDQDQLPVLQHALMRTWDVWRADHRPGEPVDLHHYEKTGGLAHALSNHADEAYQELRDERGRAIAEALFRCLTEKCEEGREARRPCTLGAIAAVAAADEAEVAAVVEAFRAPGRSFLMPPAGTPLTAGTVIDISHESLIRVWQKLRGWVQREMDSARVYRRLEETAVLHEKGEADPIRGAELQVALAWRERHQPTKAWAERYAPHFDLAMALLESSREKAEAEVVERERRRQRELKLANWLSITLAGFFIVAALAALWVYRSSDRAQAQERIARRYSYVTSVDLAHGALANDDLEQARRLLTAARPTEPDREAGHVEDFAWRYLWALAHPKPYQRLEGNERGINFVDFSPDGKTVATAGKDGTVRIFEIATSGLLATLAPKGDPPVAAVAFSPDGRFLAAGVGNDVTLWDSASRLPLATLKGHADLVQSVAFSNDGFSLASTGNDRTIRIWDVAARKLLFSLPGHRAAVYCVAFSPDGKLLASGSVDRSVKLWDLAKRKNIGGLDGFSDAVADLAFSPDGHSLAIGSWDGSVKIWTDFSNKDALTEFSKSERRGADEVWAVEFSPDGRVLASSGSTHSIRLWSVPSGGQITTLRGHSGQVHGVAFSPDGRFLASGSYDKTGGLWNLATRPELTFVADGNVPISSFAFAPKGPLLATLNSDGKVKLWDAEKRRELAVLGEHAEVAGMVFDRDGKRLAAWGYGTAKLWDVETHAELPIPEDKDHYIRLLAFDAKGALLALENDGSARALDGNRWKPLSKDAGTPAQRDRMMDLAVTPDGQVLAGATDDGITLREVRGGKTTAVLDEKDVSALAFSLDGALLASGNSRGELKIWDVEKRGATDTSPMTHGQGRSVRCLAFSPDGRTLASGDEHGEIKFWDTVTWTELTTEEGGGDVCPLGFSSDSQMLATGFPDGKVRLWIGASDAEIEAAMREDQKATAETGASPASP